MRVPGFGQFVVEVEGVCDCECTQNPVWKFPPKCLQFCYIHPSLFRPQMLPYAMTVMVTLSVVCVTVMMDGKSCRVYSISVCVCVSMRSVLKHTVRVHAMPFIPSSGLVIDASAVQTMSHHQ